MTRAERAVAMHITDTATVEQRFWARVDATGDCWEWCAYVERGGYGTFSVWGRGTRYAHRLAYEMLVGPIPEGRVIDHLCRNRRCVNPDHLEPVTTRENVHRGYSPTLRRRTHCRRGHPLDEANTRVDVGPKGAALVCRTCERAYRHARYLARKQRALELGGLGKEIRDD